MKTDLRKNIKEIVSSHINTCFKETEIDNLTDDILGAILEYDREIEDLVERNSAQRIRQLRECHEGELKNLSEFHNKQLRGASETIEKLREKLSCVHNDPIIKSMEVKLGTANKEVSRLKKVIRILLGDE